MSHFGDHFHDVVPTRQGFANGLLYRTGWTMLAGCADADPRPDRVRHGIDLRSSGETADAPTARGTAHIPIDLPSAVARLAGRPTDRDYAALYVDTLDHCGRSIAEVVTVLADLLPEPVAFGCSLGKDRTGLVAGLVLGLLDVPVDTIAEQDRRARAAILSCAEGVRSYTASRDVPESELRRRCLLGDSALRTALRVIADRYGDGAGFLVEHGAPTAALDSLRTALGGRAVTPPGR
jgi:protein-tyrosine phosphatase